MIEVAELKAKIQKAAGRRDYLKDRLTEAEKKAVSLSETLEATKMAQAVGQKAAADTQEQLRVHITDLVQSALDAVFPGKYKFGVEFEAKRGQSEARLYIERDEEQYDPIESNGGGLKDVMSLSLRMACWMLSRSDNVLLLDEPFKNLSAEYRPMMADLLYEMSRSMGLQVIMVTHESEQINAADRIFHVSQDEFGVSHVRYSDKN